MLKSLRLNTNVKSLSRFQASSKLGIKANAQVDRAHKKWHVDVGLTNDGQAHTIRLNKIDLKTPLNNPMVIKDVRLAHMIANEWRLKGVDKSTSLTSMHLTTLAYSAIDNPFKESIESLTRSIIEYLKFDTMRYRETQTEELLKLQSRHWDPMVGWFEHTFHCHVPIDYGQIVGCENLPKNTEDIVFKYLTSQGHWQLVGFRLAAESLKSFILATSLAEKFLSVDDAVRLARLETKFQTDRWSEVEWQHVLEERSTTARAAAGALFYHLSG